MIKKYLFILLILFILFLIGCQQQIKQELEEQKPDAIEIISEEPAVEEIDEEFNDNLDEALKELEEVENI